ncbi:unnamed protein product [Cladocopium goreaui]|uniref:HhH-GPD domain-containing protein n=1 Tax=Cladocopium goreaui TaxID=2562237 RepID=A0A9P1GPR5_9DINO|nr:unnamed protein product [Cladocopium goreaui]
MGKRVRHVAKTKRVLVPKGPKKTMTTSSASKKPRSSGGRRKGDWKNDLALIKRLRARRSAPVDSIGCERLANVNASQADFEWQCLVAAMLSSQTRDQATAEAMAALEAAKVNSVQRICSASVGKVAKLIKAVGFFNVKAKTLREAARICKKDYKGRIPNTLEAHLIMHSAFDRQEGICVDTHVHRIANQLKWVRSKTPEETRMRLEELLPRREWADINVLLVGLGQMQQQASLDLISQALRLRGRVDALRLLRKIGVPLRAGQHDQLDKMAAGNKDVQRLLR